MSLVFQSLVPAQSDRLPRLTSWAVSHIGINEISRQKGHVYLTNVYDLKPGITPFISIMRCFGYTYRHFSHIHRPLSC
jgi:hypothetical protein